MKKIVLELAKIVLFFIILWWVIVHITYILRNDTDEKENLMGFYAEEKNSLDAVFIIGFSRLSTAEFFAFRKTETCETKNHLLCGWCSKCL